jgi:4-hydroxybenzoate polyprenyltransferase
MSVENGPLNFTDIRADSWTDRLLPRFARPYAKLARLDRPIGWELLLYPCWWGLALARESDPGPFLLFLIGAVAMRGAGCTLNDIVDRDVDGRVERTRARPIPSGAVSVRQAIGFMFFQLAIGAAVLLCLPRLVVALGFAILAIVAIYPFMKRVTYWPQIFLGLNFNWGAVMGWAAATGSIGRPAWALYAGGVAWTLFYDTIYAHSDKEDDLAIGVKSTALRFGDASKAWLTGFALLTLALWGLAFATAGAALPSYLCLALAALHFAWQLARWRPDDPADCIAKFKSNRIIGWLMLVGCLLAG